MSVRQTLRKILNKPGWDLHRLSAIDTFLGERVAWVKRDPTAGKYYMIKMED